MSPLPTLLFLTGGGTLVAWLFVLAGGMVATRPRTVRPDPPTDALGHSRPAVVNLLTNRWRCTPDAARATLVDLVARGYLAVRRDGPDPAQTTIQIRHTDPPNLTRYERRLMGRLRSLARGGEVSLPALAFRTRRAASRWLDRFAAEVAADARARDVARTGINTDFLSATALVPASALGAWTYLRVPGDRLFSAVAVFVALLLVLHQIATQLRERHRPTLAGRAAAAHWLGVRSHLREHEPELIRLTLCRIQERRTGYAVALGLATTISEQLQFAPVRTRRAVTAAGAVRVRFPDRMRFCWGWGALGCASAGLAALLGAGLGAALLTWYGRHLPAPAEVAGWLLVAGLGVTGIGLAGLGVADVLATRARTGTVVLFEGYGHDSVRDPRLQDRYVIALRDGDRDPVPAWILPSHLGDGLAVGGTVTVRVRRWTGLVSQLAVVRGPALLAPRPPSETAPVRPRPPEPADEPLSEPTDRPDGARATPAKYRGDP